MVAEETHSILTIPARREGSEREAQRMELSREGRVVHLRPRGAAALDRSAGQALRFRRAVGFPSPRPAGKVDHAVVKSPKQRRRDRGSTEVRTLAVAVLASSSAREDRGLGILLSRRFQLRRELSWQGSLVASAQQLVAVALLGQVNLALPLVLVAHELAREPHKPAETSVGQIFRRAVDQGAHDDGRRRVTFRRGRRER